MFDGDHTKFCRYFGFEHRLYNPEELVEEGLTCFNGPPKDESAKKENQENGTTICIAAIGTVIVGLIGALAYYYYLTHKTPKVPDSKPINDIEKETNATSELGHKSRNSEHLNDIPSEIKGNDGVKTNGDSKTSHQDKSKKNKNRNRAQ
jgi:hypothetical protein